MDSIASFTIETGGQKDRDAISKQHVDVMPSSCHCEKYYNPLNTIIRFIYITRLSPFVALHYLERDIFFEVVPCFFM